MYVRRRRKWSSRLLPSLLVLTSLTAASFGLAFVWHTAQQPEQGGELVSVAPGVPQEELPEEDIPAAGMEQALSALSASGEAQPGGMEQSESVSAPEGTSGGEGSGQEAQGAAAVDNSYFDDALFIGDSISTGIPLYHVADNAKVIAFTGINTDNINYKEVIDTPEGRITMLEAAKRTAPRGKIYIMLGGNGLDFDKETFIKGYRTFLKSVQEEFPDAVIYLQSMTPVTRDCHLTYPSVSNEKINEYNLEIEALARECGVYYLNVGEALADENGELPKEASPTDGMHFTPEYYAKWFEYLKAHAVEVEKQ